MLYARLGGESTHWGCMNGKIPLAQNIMQQYLNPEPVSLQTNSQTFSQTEEKAEKHDKSGETWRDKNQHCLTNTINVKMLVKPQIASICCKLQHQHMLTNLTKTSKSASLVKHQHWLIVLANATTWW